MIQPISCRLAILVVLLWILAPPLSGQETASDPAAGEPQAPQTEMDRAADLLATVEQNHGEMVSLIAEIPEAQGEELSLKRAQLDEMALSQHANLLALVGLFEGKDALGTRGKLLEQRIAQALRRSSRQLRTYIVFRQETLSADVLQRETLSGSDLQVFEHGMAESTSRLDRYYLGLIELTDIMLRFGLGVEEEQEFLRRQLSQRGQDLLRLVELTSKNLAEYKELLKRAPGDSDLQARVFAAEERFDSNKTSLMTTIQMMKDQGLDYTDLEVRALEITGEITPEALELEVAVGLMGRTLERTRTFLIDNGPRLLVRLVTVLAILLAFWLAARLTRRLTSKVLDKTPIAPSKLLKEMIIAMAGRVVMVIGVIVVLSQMGIDLGPILAGLGIAGFIIGFALQDTLSNFAAGAMILFYRPYDVGDFVEAAGVTGKVKDMNLVSTRILTVDHQTLIVPNSKIWGDVIRNVTAQPTRRVDMVFGISYEDEIPKAEQVLMEIVEAHEKVLTDPEPVIKVHTLNDSSVDFVVRPWAATDDYWDVYWDITREVKLRFDREGISIPFPQRDVHLYSEESAEQSA